MRNVHYCAKTIDLGTLSVDVSKIFQTLRDVPDEIEHISTAAREALLEVCNTACWLPIGVRKYKFLLVVQVPTSKQRAGANEVFRPTGNMRRASSFALVLLNSNGIFKRSCVTSEIKDGSTEFIADHDLVMMQYGVVVDSGRNRVHQTESRAFLYWEEAEE